MPDATPDGDAPAGYLQVRQTFGSALRDPAAVDQQYGLVVHAEQWRDDVVAVAAVDDDVLEQDLVVAVVAPRYPQSLVGTHGHVIVPRGKPGLVLEHLLVGPLFETAADLPGAQRSKQGHEQETDDEREPCG